MSSDCKAWMKQLISLCGSKCGFRNLPNIRFYILSDIFLRYNQFLGKSQMTDNLQSDRTSVPSWGNWKVVWKEDWKQTLCIKSITPAQGLTVSTAFICPLKRTSCFRGIQMSKTQHANEFYYRQNTCIIRTSWIQKEQLKNWQKSKQKETKVRLK